MAGTSGEWNQYLALFGKTKFREQQEEIIRDVLAGHSVLAVLPTGAGKSLCYQMPAAMLGKLSLVVSPLIALMKDQVDYLVSLGIAARRYDSSLAEEERFSVLKEIASGHVCLLFAAPESLTRPELLEAMAEIPLGLFVADEAHCLSEWGHSFRPDYLALPDYAMSRPFHAVMAVTATATPQVRDDLAGQFGIKAEHIYCLPPDRPHIRRVVVAVPTNERREKLTEILQEPEHLPGIVYVRTRRETEDWAAWLTQQGWTAKAYHAGMPVDIRAKVQEAFLSGQVPLMVATIAFGMGIDKPNVRTVVHVSLPDSIEAYVQESGRAGRDGLPSLSYVLFSERDFVVAANRIHASLPARSALMAGLKRLLSPSRHVISHYGVVTECDLAENVFDRLFFELKRSGVLREIGHGNKFYKVKPRFPLDEIVYGREDDEIARLQWMDQHREGETMELASTWGYSLDEAMAWLRELELSGEWVLSLRQNAVEVEIDKNPRTIHEWTDYYFAMFHERMKNDLQRLSELKKLLTQADCLNSGIRQYFGFPRALCGSCSSCQGNRAVEIVELPRVELTQRERQELAQLSAQRLPCLSEASQMTRFLIGYPGPAAMQARMWAHPLYGALSDMLWDDVYTEAFAMLGQ